MLFWTKIIIITENGSEAEKLEDGVAEEETRV
jgi:hypothetical protein